MTNVEESIYQKMIEDIADHAILLLDNGGYVKTWNKGAQKIMAYAAGEVIDKHFSIFYTERDIVSGAPHALLKQAAREGSAMTEGWQVRKDGSRLWASVVITAIYDDHEQLSGFTRVTRDLTEKKKAEDTLRQFNTDLERRAAERAEELNVVRYQYRHIFMNNPLPMWVMDTGTFRFLEVNEAAESVYGYSRDEFLAMSVVDIRPDAEKDVFLTTDHPELLGKENHFRGIWRHKKKDGSIIEVEIFAHDVEFEGRPARLILSHDITYRRLAEKKLASRVRYFRALLENNYDAILLHDEKGYISYQSPATERMTGYSIEEIRHINAFDLFHSEDKAEMMKKLNEAMAVAGKIVWIICRVRHKAGYYLWVEGTLTNLLADEHVGAIVGNFRDITERKLTGEQLMKSKREVEKVYREQIILSERLSSIFNALPANIALIDQQGVIVSVNDAWRRYPETNSFIGHSYGIDDNYIEIAERTGGADGKKIAYGIRAILGGGMKDMSMEYRCGEEGRERWQRVIITRENSNADSGIVLMHIDITDRIKAEQQTNVQKKQLENLMRGMGDAFVTLDKDWNYTFANEHALALMQKQWADIAGRSIWQVFPEIKDTRFEKEYRIVAALRKNADFEVYYDSYDMWMAVRAYPHEDGIAIFYNNITERKKAEQELTNSEHKFRALTEHSADMLVLYDKDLELSYCSPSVEKNAGVKMEQIKGVSIFDHIYPEDEAHVRTLIEKVLLKEGVTVPFELRKWYGQGDPVFLEGSMTNLLSDPAVMAIVCNYRDITERKGAERQLEESYKDIERLLLHTDEAFIMLDTQLNVISFNKNAHKLSREYLNSEIVAGISVYALASNQYYAKYGPIYADVLKGLKREVEMEFERVEGSKIYFLNLIKPIVHNGHVEGVFITIRDITEKKAVQEKIEFDRNNLEALINNTDDLLWSTDVQRRLVSSNKAFDDMVLYMSGNKVKQGIKLTNGFSEQQLARWNSWYDRAFTGESFNTLEYTPPPFDRWAETSFYPIRNGIEIVGVACYSRDITERIQNEKKIININRLYAFISEINQTIVHASDQATVFREACRIAVECGKFKMAWIGEIDAGSKIVNLVEDNGMSAMERALFMNMRYDDNSPTGIVMDTGRYFYSNDVLNDDRIEKWKPYARNTGVNSIMVLPIRSVNVVVGTFNLYATELDLFDMQEITMLEEVASDISFSMYVFEKEKQRKVSLEKVRQNEFRLNEAQEIAHIGNWEIDLVTGAQSWSKEALRIIGYVQNLDTPVFESYLNSIHPDDKMPVMKMITEARTSNQNIFFYHRIIRDDGETRYIYSESKYEFNEQDQPVRLHGIIHDITNAKIAEDALAQSEENLRLIMDLIPQAIYARDVNGKLLFVNKSFAKLLGLSPGQMISNAITDGNGAAAMRELLAEKDKLVIASGRTEILPELEFRDIDGSTRSFYTIKVPYTLAGSKEAAVLGIAMDVTERKLAELERNRMVADLVQRNKDLEQFSYIISHNLRSPVSNISGIADVMQFEGMSEEEKAELMKELMLSVEKLDSVIKDLNYILQVKQEYSEHREMVNFSELLGDIQHSIKNLINNEQVRFITDFSGAEGIMTLKSYLYSVIFNLVSNSIKYRRPGVPPVIQVTSRRTGGKIIIEFEDNGLGIDLNKKGAQVFGLYKRFHSHTEGKGVGLYMVKTQVETLGGRIHIESEVNKGTKFIIELEVN